MIHDTRAHARCEIMNRIKIVIRIEEDIKYRTLIFLLSLSLSFPLLFFVFFFLEYGTSLALFSAVSPSTEPLPRASHHDYSILVI